MTSCAYWMQMHDHTCSRSALVINVCIDDLSLSCVGSPFADMTALVLSEGSRKVCLHPGVSASCYTVG